MHLRELISNLPIYQQIVSDSNEQITKDLLFVHRREI